jgi:hypothetical protein
MKIRDFNVGDEVIDMDSERVGIILEEIVGRYVWYSAPINRQLKLYRVQFKDSIEEIDAGCLYSELDADEHNYN